MSDVVKLPAQIELRTEIRRVEVLDSLRGICALMVALHHFKANGILADNKLVQNSFLFVDFFFVLSGYVIAMNYSYLLGSFREVRSFCRKRFARIYPLHVATIVPFLLVELFIVPHFPAMRQPFSPPMSIESLGLNLLLLNCIGLTEGLTWNYPSWSIGAEFFTYLGFAITIFTLGKFAKFAFILTIGVALVWLAQKSPDYIDATHDFGLIRCALGFATGTLLWGGLGKRRSPQLTKYTWTIVEFAALCFSLSFVILANHSVINLASPFVFACAVAVFSQERGHLSQGLRWRGFVYLGTISFSIYMVHAFVASRLFSSTLAIIGAMGGPNLIDPSSGRMGAVAWQGNALTMSYIFVLLLLATLARLFIELPGQRLILGRNEAVKSSPLRGYAEANGLPSKD
jgi:peptidoglycan/LPS O-acetylase OafA/YrhL